jgi:hypothetical protein
MATTQIYPDAVTGPVFPDFNPAWSIGEYWTCHRIAGRVTGLLADMDLTLAERADLAKAQGHG